MKLRVNFLPFIRQNKALYKAGWRNLFIFARNLPIVFNNLFLFQWRWSGLHEDHDVQLAIEVIESEPYCFEPWDMWARLPAVRAAERAKNLTIRRSQIGSMERRIFTIEQQSAQLDLIVQGNEFLIWYDTIINIKVDQKLSDLFQGNHSQTFNKVKKSLRPSPLLKLKACFSRQVDVVPPQAVATKVTVLYVAVHLNLRSVHDGRLLGLFLPQLRKFKFWLTEQYFIFQMKQDIKTS